MTQITNYAAKSGRLEPVFMILIQNLPGDVDRILDAVMKVTPLSYGNYERNASVTGQGYETARPKAGSTTDNHVDAFQPGDTETYPMVELKISIPEDVKLLEDVMDAIIYVHHYEEPVIFVQSAWASRAAYNPNSTNPNRWWNNGRGLPEKITP